jgi:two-component system NtrC family sensor kinase
MNVQAADQSSPEVYDMLPIAMAKLDYRGVPLYVNRACRELLESMQKQPRDLPAILPKRHRALARKALAEKHAEDVTSLHGGRALRVVFRPAEDESSVYLFLIDLTDQEETKAQLMQSEKMASLGLLVAGLAHEINTPLGAIHSNNDTMSKSVARIRQLLKKDQQLNDREHVMRVLDVLDELCRNTAIAAERLIGISGSLRDFTRRDEAAIQKVNIHEGLDKTLLIVQHKLKDRIRVEKRYGNVPMVDGHPNRLNQVFMNLLVNAAQAIPDRGTITISTSKKGAYAAIAISDDGVGIPAENLSKVFDPGFTTKGVGVGTGLGLSICYKIVQEHHGRIEVDSGPRGTTFTIFLPLKPSQKGSHE